jgi:hypothetical protein
MFHTSILRVKLSGCGRIKIAGKLFRTQASRSLFGMKVFEFHVIRLYLKVRGLLKFFIIVKAGKRYLFNPISGKRD